MKISNVYVRFYRSFNYDYLRKADESVVPLPWEQKDGDLFYPFVRVPLKAGITTIVGGNESGKSQLLEAIKYALTGNGIRQEDFCRYSSFFVVNREMPYPDVGLEFNDLSKSDQTIVVSACGMQETSQFDKFAFFRFGNKAPTIYVLAGGVWIEHAVVDESILREVIPHYFEIDANVPLPDSIPIEYLVSGKRNKKTPTRKARRDVLDLVLRSDTTAVTSERAVSILNEIQQCLSQPHPKDKEYWSGLKLADDLLTKVAHLNRSAFSQLLEAIDGDSEAYANAIVEQINRELASNLNFPRWWSQDSHFQLLVSLRDKDLVFTIRDRTGTEYSFSERSSGLKYFLSYFVQYLAHEYPNSEIQEVLLMDEPDAYLSNVGQQDLLRIFDGFAFPEDGRPSCQVVYVTHSPFLIDKNHSDRVRVLEKGEGEEGTRVVRSVARNHYEPLRSAFGSFLAETTFISNCNLMVEGVSDQILLAGMSTHLRRRHAARMESLDLNTITLVPAGSASHIPYMVFLARGRDVDKPAVIVLLDGDSDGVEARKTLERGGPRRKQLIKPEFVLQFGDQALREIESSNPAGVLEIEDLIPARILVAAARKLIAEYAKPGDEGKLDGTDESAFDFSNGRSTHEALLRVVSNAIGTSVELDKVGLARSVVEIVNDGSVAEIQALEKLESNFRVLFRELGRLQRNALNEVAQEKVKDKINRVTSKFFTDHREKATREQAHLLIDDITADLEGLVVDEALLAKLRQLRHKHGLTIDMTENVSDFGLLKMDLESLRYFETIESLDPE